MLSQRVTFQVMMSQKMRMAVEMETIVGWLNHKMVFMSKQSNGRLGHKG
jgi:hypothetical protein